MEGESAENVVMMTALYTRCFNFIASRIINELWGIDRSVWVDQCCCMLFSFRRGDEALLSHYVVKSLDIQKQVESRKVHDTIRTEAENVPCTE